MRGITIDRNSFANMLEPPESTTEPWRSNVILPTSDRIERSANASPSLEDARVRSDRRSNATSEGVDATSQTLAMAFPPTLGLGEATNIVYDAIGRSLERDHGAVDLHVVREEVNGEFVRRNAGSMKLDFEPEGKASAPSRYALKSRDGLIRIYASSDHGGRGDGGVRIDVRPGGVEQRDYVPGRLRFDPHLGVVEIPYVPTALRGGSSDVDRE